MKVYKYVTADRADAIKNKNLRFTPSNEFNDPFELKPNISKIATNEDIYEQVQGGYAALIEEQWAKLPPQHKALISKEKFSAHSIAKMPHVIASVQAITNELTQPIKGVFHEHLERFLGVLCLTESPNNLLMWAHYTACHTGLLLEFNSTNPFFDQRLKSVDSLRHIRKVEYVTEREELALIEQNEMEFLFKKGDDWKYEEEHRMILPLEHADEIITVNKTTVHLFNYPPECLRSVTIGCRASEETKTNIREILKSDPTLHHVELLQTEISETSYNLKFMPQNL